MIINIDHFQEINDLYGDAVGDEVLREVAAYLREIIPVREHLYRLHADEFAHLCDGGMDVREFVLFASYVGERISQKSFTVRGRGEVSLSVTMGIAHGSDSLLTNADIALTLAKKEKKNFLVYDESMAMAKEYEKNLEWTKRLKKAIDEERIVPLFQPIVDTGTGAVVKYEALMRMVDERGDFIAPVHFIELAKKNKLYHQLTKIMIHKTMERFADVPYVVSINISVEDILNKEIYGYIVSQLKERAIGEKIIFEIIESEGIENFARVIEFIEEVKRYGAKIAIDDFGTGYSNFSYLSKLDVDYLKIDGSLIKNITTDADHLLTVESILFFARKKEIETIAEFVEDEEIFAALVDLGIDYSQGYLFSAPQPTIEP